LLVLALMTMLWQLVNGVMLSITGQNSPSAKPWGGVGLDRRGLGRARGADAR
jgi:hypothetical protein